MYVIHNFLIDLNSGDDAMTNQNVISQFLMLNRGKLQTDYELKTWELFHPQEGFAQQAVVLNNGFPPMLKHIFYFQHYSGK